MKFRLSGDTLHVPHLRRDNIIQEGVAEDDG